jgi:N-acetylglucosamine-6-sulfatase
VTNAIVIFADDMRADVLPYMPKTRLRFAGGTEFTQARVQGPKCEPSRWGYLAGQTWHHHNTAVTEIPFEDLLPTWLDAEGVECAMVGKFLASQGGYAEPIVTGHSYWRVLSDANDQHEFTYGVTEDGVNTIFPWTASSLRQIDYLTQEAVQYITGTPGDPFYLWFCPTHPHTFTFTGAQTPKPEHALKWASVRWPINLSESIADKPSWLATHSPSALTPADALTLQRLIRWQLRELAALDDAIDTLFSTLEAEDLLDDTIVIFTSDNGVMFGEHRLGATNLVFKNVSYEGAVRVPLLATGPGFNTSKCHVPTWHHDITRMLVNLYGATPTLPNQAGTDLRTIGENAGGIFNDRTTLHQWSQDNPLLVGTPGFDSVVTGPDHSSVPSFKYTLNHDDDTGNGEEELYDLANDPYEYINLAANGAYSATKSEMIDELNAWAAHLP